MKPLLITTLILSVATAFAAKPGKGRRDDHEAEHAAQNALKSYDKNGNGTLEGDELAAVQKAFAESPQGLLKPLDANKDGKLDATEVKIESGGRTGREARGAIMEIVKEVDKDHNHKFEGAEVEELKKKFAENPKAFGRMDHNSNGKLEDDEIAKINERLSARAEGSKGRTRKQAAAPATPAKPAPADAPKPQEGESIKKAEPTTK